MIAERQRIGRHPCGGDVWYLATPSMGWRVCIGGCGQSSLKGDDLDTEAERAARARAASCPICGDDQGDDPCPDCRADRRDFPEDEGGYDAAHEDGRI